MVASYVPVRIVMPRSMLTRTILPQIAFAILYGFNCGCFISLTPAVAARVYGPTRLAGLSGMLFVFNLPGELSLLCNLSIRTITPMLLLPGNAAGAPVAGALLKATGHSWRAVAFIMGGLQVLGAVFLLYGEYSYGFLRHLFLLS